MSVRDPLTRRVAAALRLGHWERDDHGRLRRGKWMQSFSGARIFPLDPRPEEIYFDDFCIGLARECRYGNHSRRFYSVSEHSVIVSLYVEKLALERGWSPYETRHAARQGLVHDLPEAYLGDVPRPLKMMRAMRGYRKLEAKWWGVTCERFNLRSTPESNALVHEVDDRILIDEIEVLLLNPERIRTGRYAKMKPLGATIACLPWERAAEVFAQRFDFLFPEEVDGIREAISADVSMTSDELQEVA